MEDGRVIGVRAVSANGTPYEYKAGKGVVLATGGFGANVEMRVKYNSIWADLGPTVPTTNSPAITGDGIVKMCIRDRGLSLGLYNEKRFTHDREGSSCPKL